MDDNIKIYNRFNCNNKAIEVLKGQENLSLETMSKIEACLNISILQEELEMV